MTYEKGYHWLQGNLKDFFDELLKLMLDEEDLKMRSKFVELVGDSQHPDAIPYLEKELLHYHYEVRSWAYNSLVYFEDPKAFSIAEAFKENHPEEEFLH